MSNHDPDPNDTSAEGPKHPEWTPSRRLSRKGMSRARSEDLTAHAKVEARRKAERRETRTPSRDDVARAALYAVLLAISDRPKDPVTHALRRVTLDSLQHALFDPAEADRVLTDMAVRSKYDWVEWMYGRAFRTWRDGGCKGERPKRLYEVSEIPRRPNGTMPWTNTTPGAPGSKRRGASPDDPA